MVLQTDDLSGLLPAAFFFFCSFHSGSALPNSKKIKLILLRREMTHLCSAESHPSLLGLLLLDLHTLFTFLVSHPVLLVYLFLLSPYLLQLLSFFYPIVFCNCLLLISLPSLSSHVHVRLPAFLGHTCSAVHKTLQVEFGANDAKAGLIEQLCSLLQLPDDNFIMELSGVDLYYKSGTNFNAEENSGHKILSASQRSNISSSNIGNGGGDTTKAREKTAEQLIESTVEKASKEEENTTNAFVPFRKDHSCRPSEIIQRLGSTRKEGEWRRSLACKLYEERMTYRLCEERKLVEGAVEMDLLWEAYEIDSRKIERGRRKEEHVKKTEHKEVELDEEEDDEEASRQLCCLQALRLSAGKLNIGMGRPSLVKISKAIKGIALYRRTGRKNRNP